MRRLIHWPHDPGSRFVRLALGEKGLPFELDLAPFGADDPRIAAIHPAGGPPVMVDQADTAAATKLAPAPVIVEYLAEVYGRAPLFPMTAPQRAETRRLIGWVCGKFESEVIEPLVREQLDKRLAGGGAPDYDILRLGMENLDWHMDYFAYLLDQRKWLAGETMTAADLALGAYLSSLDYVDAMAWSSFAPVKDWYARMKSRPSFRPILADDTPGHAPPRHYADLDF